MNLSPTQLHYFKRHLVSLQLQQELCQLRHNPDLAGLLHSDACHSAFPFLHFITQTFVVEFPLLKRGSHDMFWNKCNAFLVEFSKVKLDTYAPKHASASQRRILAYKLQKALAISLCAAIRTVQNHADQGTEAITETALSDASSSEDRMIVEQQLSLLESEDRYLEWVGFNGLKIDIVTVREATEKHRMREKTHAEFILCSTLTESSVPIYVGRRHGQFRKLCKDLRSDYPAEDVPCVPNKVGDHRRDQLYRDKDRLLLRSVLRRIAINPALAKSTRFRDFLTKDPTTLTDEDRIDAEKRSIKDNARLAEEQVFRQQVDLQMAELQSVMSSLKKQVMQPGGLMSVFATIRTTEHLQDLPKPLLKAFEWGRINFAFSLHTQFITSDRAAENMSNLKRIHALVPYRAMARLLKMSNPFGMIRGVLDLFLAQPFGGRSLFQRIILSSMNDEIKEFQQEITELETAINDNLLCAKIKNAIETPLPDSYASVQSTTGIAEVLDILRNDEIEPLLTPNQIIRVAAAASGANDNASMESRALVKKLHQLWALYARKREHELLMSVVFQGVTGELLKEIFATFYQPLADVYKAANVGDTMTHLSAFIDDLIDLLDRLDGEDVQNTTQPFIQLVQHHENNFYTFVHNVHARDKACLFDELLKFVDDIFVFIAHGLPGHVDMDAVIADAHVADRMPELMTDIDALCVFYTQRKTQRAKRRRRKLAMNNASAAEPLDDMLNQTEAINMLDDLVDMEYDLEDSHATSDDIVHELAMQPPNLTVLPDVVPAFVEHVKRCFKEK